MSLLSLRLIRRFIAGLFAFSHLGSFTLQLILHSAFTQPVVSWVMGIFEMVIIVWFITAALIKPIMKLPHTIMHEILGSFTMFVGGTVLALFALNVTVSPEAVKGPLGTIMAIWIRMLVFSVFVQIGYTFLFSVLAGLTCVAYDRTIWVRDMDGSPSPFSMSLLLAVALPHVFKPYDTAYTASLTPQDDSFTPSRPICCDRDCCRCPTKPPTLEPASETQHSSTSPSPAPHSSTNGTPIGSTLRQGFTRLKKGSVSSTHSLIQVPDAAQRRMSYPVSLGM